MNAGENYKKAFAYERIETVKEAFTSVIKVNGFEVLEPSKKEKILKHLKAGELFAAGDGGTTIDEKTGEEILLPLNAFTDGVFIWITFDIYFFEKYDVKLSEEFKRHVLG